MLSAKLERNCCNSLQTLDSITGDSRRRWSREAKLCCKARKLLDHILNLLDSNRHGQVLIPCPRPLQPLSLLLPSVIQFP